MKENNLQITAHHRASDNTPGTSLQVAPVRPPTATQGLEPTSHTSASEVTNPARVESQAAPSINELTYEPAMQVPSRRPEPTRAQTSAAELRTEQTDITAVATVSVEEHWATPATQQVPLQQQQHALEGPQLGTTEESFSPAHVPADDQSQLQPTEGVDEAFGLQDAGDWLDNMIDIDSEWLP
ncbi:hypothetical protein MMC13_008046 [Lambiella insularis]|nr:hypothetical protein [Lambiella insularis]